MKRLFIFAAYDQKDNIIDNSLIVYVRALRQNGDVVFYMDNDAPQPELKKIESYVLYAGASRHCEYDFGSYKRGFVWARDNGILGNYDWVYMVNDSMYAPLYSLSPVLEKLESYPPPPHTHTPPTHGADATGIVFHPHKNLHIQTWFFGMSRRVFLSKQFESFISNVTKQKGKGGVTYHYENGFTRLLLENDWTWTALYTMKGRATYNKIKFLFKRGDFPFLKKVSFIRQHGLLGRQVLYILNHIDPELKNAILENARREYGVEYVKNFLTNNLFKIIFRSIKHFLYQALRVAGR